MIMRHKISSALLDLSNGEIEGAPFRLAEVKANREGRPAFSKIWRGARSNLFFFRCPGVRKVWNHCVPSVGLWKSRHSVM